MEHVDSQRYAESIRACMPARVAVPAPVSPDGGACRVDAGVILAVALAGGSAERFAPPTIAPGAGAKVVDAAGHQRPHYAGLMCYCWAQALRVLRPALPPETADTWGAALRAWCDLFARRLADRPPADGPTPASAGAAATADAWEALALIAASSLLSTPAVRAIAAATFAPLVRHPHASGSFLHPTASDNPETFWFHELVLLHAVASYAALDESAPVAAAAARHAEWVQDETQPDHATSEPWGLHAFAANPRTQPTADALLHAVRVLHPGGASGVSLMLLADALYCLRPPARRPEAGDPTDEA